MYAVVVAGAGLVVQAASLSMVFVEWLNVAYGIAFADGVVWVVVVRMDRCGTGEGVSAVAVGSALPAVSVGQQCWWLEM